MLDSGEEIDFWFQSTRPRGARQQVEAETELEDLFQSTRPRGARLERAPLLVVDDIGFNPRARGGRDKILRALCLQGSLFQSTRPRGARRVFDSTRLGLSSFQSTRPRGARQSVETADAKPAVVSIHAPAGGATRASSSQCPFTSCFNPRARGGRDCYLYMHLILNILRTPFREPFFSHLS